MEWQRIPFNAVCAWTQSGQFWYPVALDVVCGYCDRTVTVTAVQRQDNMGLVSTFGGQCPGCKQMLRFFVLNQESTSRENLHIMMCPASKVDRQPLQGVQYIPEGVRRSYFNTLNSYKSSNWVATAVMVRRTLEGLVKDVLGDKAKKLPLAKGLDEIPRYADLAGKVLEPAHILRQGGNLGAHYDEEREPTEEVARSMFSFLEYLLEFVYVLPHKSQDLANTIRSLTRVETDEDTENAR
jgi:hypothetical protein